MFYLRATGQPGANPGRGDVLQIEARPEGLAFIHYRDGTEVAAFITSAEHELEGVRIEVSAAALLTNTPKQPVSQATRKPGTQGAV